MKKMVLATTLLLAANIQPAQAETSLAACLSANGSRLYNMTPFSNDTRPCRNGDLVIKLQMEQPGTVVRKLRGTMTTPGEVELADFDGLYQVVQRFDGSDCAIEVWIAGGTYVYIGPPETVTLDPAAGPVVLRSGPFTDSGEAPTGPFRLDDTVAPEDDTGHQIHGGPYDLHQFFVTDTTLVVTNVIATTEFDEGACFAAATVRYAPDASALYGP
jgi:hypothetical protein